MSKKWSKKGVSQKDYERKAKEKDEKYGGSTFRGKGYLREDMLDTFIPKEGENCIRIVEPVEVEKLGFWAMTVRFHRNVGYDKDYYLCNKWMRGKHGDEFKFPGGCFIDEQQTSELWDEDPDLAKTYYPSPQRELMLVLDLSSEEPNKLLKFSCPKTLCEDIIGQSKRKGSDVYVDVSDPKDGVAVYFDRFGKGRDTRYKNVQLGEDTIPLDDSIADARVPLYDLLVVPSYDDVKTAFLGDDDGGSKSYDEPEKEEEPDEPVDDEFTALDRAGLKKLLKKANPEFIVYKTTTDDEIRDELRSLAEPEEEPDEPEPEKEEEPDEPEEKSSKNSADDIKKRLKSAIKKRNEKK